MHAVPPQTASSESAPRRGVPETRTLDDATGCTKKLENAMGCTKTKRRGAPKHEHTRPHMHTYDGWVERLRVKSLAFLVDQQMLRRVNGVAYDRAIDNLVKLKRAEGETIAPRPKRTRVLVEDDDADFVIEHVASGPKGQTTRVKVPRSLHSG